MTTLFPLRHSLPTLLARHFVAMYVGRWPSIYRHRSPMSACCSPVSVFRNNMFSALIPLFRGIRLSGNLCIATSAPILPRFALSSFFANWRKNLSNVVDSWQAWVLHFSWQHTLLGSWCYRSPVNQYWLNDNGQCQCQCFLKMCKVNVNANVANVASAIMVYVNDNVQCTVYMV